jgi:diaminopimelate decarboxylase
MQVVMLHAHIGSGPQFQELHDNLTRLTGEFATLVAQFPNATAINLGGGIPHNYHDPERQIPLDPLRDLFIDCRNGLSRAVGRGRSA